MKLPDRVRKAADILELSSSNWLWLLFNQKPKKRKSHKKSPGPIVKKTSSRSNKKTTTSKPKKRGKVTVRPFPAVAPPAPVLSRKQSQVAEKLAMSHKWQYVADHGKWSDYTPAASKELERAYASWIVSPHIDVRSVKSGDWEYMVDFNLSQQTNVKHPNHKIRKIQRILLK